MMAETVAWEKTEHFSAEFVEQTHALFQAFFGSLTSTQFQSLKAGAPDDFTKLLVGEIMLCIVAYGTDFAFNYLNSVHMHEGKKYVPSCKDTLFQIISQYLGNIELYHSSVWSRLTNMIDDEIQQNVSIEMHLGFHNKDATGIKYSTPIRTLALMVNCLLEILRNVSFNTSTPSPPQTHERETEDRSENSIFDDALYETDTSLPYSTDIEFSDEDSECVVFEIKGKQKGAKKLAQAMTTSLQRGTTDREIRDTTDRVPNDTTDEDWRLTSDRNLSDVKGLEGDLKLSKTDEGHPLPDTSGKSPETRVSITDNVIPLLEVEKNKILVKLLIELVLLHIFCETKMIPENKNELINHLFECIWAEVEGTDIHITYETILCLCKKIYKDLLKDKGEHSLMSSLTLQCPLTQDYLVSVFKLHLIEQPKKPHAIIRFFSSLGRALSYPFRCRNRVSPFKS